MATDLIAFREQRITAKLKKDYLQNGGTTCPHCGSENVESTDSVDDFCGAVISQQIECADCHATWRDHYQLFDITNLFVPPDSTADSKGDD